MSDSRCFTGMGATVWPVRISHESAVNRVQGWNTTYNICEDHELWLRLSRFGPGGVIA